jgi:hypothetical protein
VWKEAEVRGHVLNPPMRRAGENIDRSVLLASTILLEIGRRIADDR